MYFIGILETIQMFDNYSYKQNLISCKQYRTNQSVTIKDHSMEHWKYNYDHNHTFTRESNFGIK